MKRKLAAAGVTIVVVIGLTVLLTNFQKPDKPNGSVSGGISNQGEREHQVHTSPLEVSTSATAQRPSIDRVADVAPRMASGQDGGNSGSPTQGFSQYIRFQYALAPTNASQRGGAMTLLGMGIAHKEDKGEALRDVTVGLRDSRLTEDDRGHIVLGLVQAWPRDDLQRLADRLAEWLKVHPLRGRSAVVTVLYKKWGEEDLAAAQASAKAITDSSDQLAALKALGVVKRNREQNQAPEDTARKLADPQR